MGTCRSGENSLGVGFCFEVIGEGGGVLAVQGFHHAILRRAEQAVAFHKELDVEMDAPITLVLRPTMSKTTVLFMVLMSGLVDIQTEDQTNPRFAIV